MMTVSLFPATNLLGDDGGISISDRSRASTSGRDHGAAPSEGEAALPGHGSASGDGG